MPKIAVFPGSFDPITKGHEQLVLKALPVFDEIIVAIGYNADKKGFFSLERRIDMVKTLFAEYPKVKVETYTGLTVDFCQSRKADYLLRGLRSSADFEFERGVALANKKLQPSLETLFFITDAEYSYISSSIVRDVLRNGGDIAAFIPDKIQSLIQK